MQPIFPMLIWSVVLITISFVGVFYIYFRRKNSKGQIVSSFLYFFSFFFLYSLFIFLEYYLLERFSSKSIFFYNLAIASLGFGTYKLFSASLDSSSKDAPKNTALKQIYFFGIFIAILLHMFYPVAPGISFDGYQIFIYQNQWVEYYYDFFMFVAGWGFAFYVGKGFLIVQSRILKAKALIIALGAFLMPFASIFYFGATGWEDIRMGLIFTLSGIILLFLGGFLPNLISAFYTRDNQEKIK